MSRRSKLDDDSPAEAIADYVYHVQEPRIGYRYNVCRAGVFNPLFGNEWTRWSAQAVYHRLRKYWHWQVGRLRKEGWPKVQDGKAYAYMCNCPPFGVVCRDSGRSCKRPTICPFCFARTYLMNTYLALEKVIFGTKEKPHEPDKSWRLVEFVATRSLSPANEIWDDAGKKLVLQKAQYIVRSDRRLEVDLLKPIAGFTLHRMEFFSGVWPLKRSGVFLCQAGRLQMRQPKYGVRRQKIHDTLTRKTLVQALARTFSFPKTLFDTPADDLRFYVEMFEGMRMFAGYGKVRGEQGRQSQT